MEVFELIRGGIMNDDLSYLVFQLILLLFTIDLILYIFIWFNLLQLNSQIKNGKIYQEPLRSIISGFEEIVEISSHRVNTAAYVEDFFSTYKVALLPFFDLVSLPVISTIKFIKNTVSLFILIGVLGTFIGIYSSLVQLLTAEMTEEVGFLAGLESMAPVLSGMGTAFATSIVGMGFALLTTFSLKLFNVEQYLSGIMVRLENYLDNEIKLAKKSKQTKQINQLNNTLQQGMQKISNQLEDIFASVKGFKQISTQFEQAAASMESFNHGLTDSMQDLQEFYQKNKEFTQGFQADISRLGNKLELLGDSIDALNDHERELDDFLASNQKLQQENLKTLEELAVNLEQSHQLLEDKMQQLAATAANQEERLGDSYQKLIEQKGEAFNNVDQAAQKLSHQVANIQNDFRQELNKNVSTFAEHVDISTKVISNGFESLEEKFNQMDSVLGKYLHGLAFNTSDLEQDLKQLNSIMAALKDNIDSQGDVLEEFISLVDKLDDSGESDLDEKIKTS